MVEAQPDEFRYLQGLARDKTAAGRRILTSTISDLFFDQRNVLSDREHALMTEILRKLIEDVEVSIRRTLAERLADLPDAPLDLVMKLANDEIEVAHPILVRSGVLSDPELIEIIRNRTLEHRLAIALRKSLSMAVVDALVACGECDVIRTLLENPEARISIGTLEYLVEESQRVDLYQNPLVRRAELTPALARRMYGWVSEALKAYILDNFEIEEATLDKAMEPAVAALAATPAAAVEPTKATSLARLLWGGETLTSELMVHTLRDGEVSLFIAMFAQFTEIPPPMVQRMLFEAGGDSLCIACKAAGIDKTSFASIYLATRKAQVGRTAPPLSDMAGILALYDRIAMDAAASLLHKWQSDPAFLQTMWQDEHQPVRPLVPHS